MPDGIRWVGLDVHARESTVAVFDQATDRGVGVREPGCAGRLASRIAVVPGFSVSW